MYDNERKPSEFMLQSSEVAALITLSRSSVIALEDKAYDAFIAALDAPVKANARLIETVCSPATMGTVTEFKVADSNQR